MIFRRLVGGLLAALFLVATASAKIVDEVGILSSEITDRLNTIGLELYDKAGVTLDLVILNDKNRVGELKNSVLNATDERIALVLVPSQNSQEVGLVDIFVSDSAKNLFDKEAVLSPFPNSGSILPLLTSKKTPQYSPAMLNGYADISERIAKTKNIELDSGIGDQNRTVINLLRYLIYGTILLVVIVLVYRKLRGKIA